MAAGGEKTIPNAVKFVFGGVSGMGATLFVQPLDLVKNRMQLSGLTGKKEFRNSFHALSSIVRNEGVLAVYTGLSAGLLRQATYTTTRLGVYTWMMEHFTDATSSPSFIAKAAIGMGAGAIGSFVGTPAEGCLPTVTRAMVVNAAQLATYSQAKQALLDNQVVKDGIVCHLMASMMSGLATTIVSMPVDISKTRIQSMRIVDGVPEYRNAFDVWAKIIRNEGVFALWKGFTPYYMRLGPHTVLTFIILEQMNNAYCKYVLGKTVKAGL